MYLTTIIFVIVALLGAYLLTYILLNKNTPKGLAMAHGFFAFIGLVLLFIASFRYRFVFYSFIILFFAAVGGIILFLRDMLGKSLPKYLAISHGLLAILGLIVLFTLTYTSYFS